MRDKVIQADIDAAKRYLQGAGPWAFDEIGINADDSLVQAFAAHRAAILAELEAPSVEMVESAAKAWSDIRGYAGDIDAPITAAIQAIAAHLKR